MKDLPTLKAELREELLKRIDGANELRLVGKESGFVFPRGEFNGRETDAVKFVVNFLENALDRCAEEVMKECVPPVKMVGTDIQDISPAGLGFNTPRTAILEAFEQFKK